MKWAGFALAIVLISSAACSRMDKLVEQGRYEEVIDKAQQRLAGKKKRTKDVKSVERAFAKAIQVRMDQVTDLRIRGGMEDWERIHGIARDIGGLQDAIDPLLPLVSEDGYRATFTSVDDRGMAREAAQSIARIAHEESDQLLSQARRGDKSAAREAHDLLLRLERYRVTGGDWRQKMDQAIRLGTSFLYFEVQNKSPFLLSEEFVDEMVRYDLTYQDHWMVVHSSRQSHTDYDYKVDLIVRSIDISPERLTETIHNFEKEIDVTDWARDRDGEFILDTLGERIEVTIPQTVRGQVVELLQQKEGSVELAVRLNDAQSGQMLTEELFTADYFFENIASRRSGDDRAIDGRWLEIGGPIPFPSDRELLLQTANRANALIVDYLHASDERWLN